MEWLNLGVRWIHMIVGIAWIGASFYFVWLENNLDRRNPKEGLAGELWAIHGGGIYHLTKFKLAPPQMPEHLHWFKWEAYTTWLSGVALLCVVFYANPALYLLPPGSTLSPAVAVAFGLGSLAVAWAAYEILCDSALGERPALLGLVLFGLIVAAAYGFSQVFSGRGAYLHVGAIMGTIMVGNVFRVIMPAQRALVAAIAEGRTPDPALPAKGLLRSRHNNYFTLPVLFIMISNHFPSTYGSAYNWLILAAIAAIAVLVRHYFNTRHNSQRFAWALPVGALAMVSLAYVTGPAPLATSASLQYQPLPETALGGQRFDDRPATQPATPEPAAKTATPPATAAATPAAQPGTGFDRVHGVIQERCAVCHSAHPTSSLFSSAPAGILFDTPEQIQQLAPRIQAQAVSSQIMPLGNITQMTPEERKLLGDWIAAGANIRE
nr:urate hydroxylase PuuD [Pseudomonas sp. RIT-PI-S]